MEEVWKDIKGFDGIYQISSLGRVKSFYKNETKILKQHLMPNGYMRIRLKQNNIRKWSDFYVHRLVAIAFLPNEHNFAEINHIDENKTNNTVANLEWCTRAYNCKYGTARERMARTKGTAVIQFDLNGNFIAEFPSLKSAAKKLGCDVGQIKTCLNPNSVPYKKNIAAKYIWKYA